ncbi:hypothetical protein GH714_040374 [Hevea brasiliensis]|uniref:Uncharacterized protein n=1 Tax=Hevea brasiliensis TaxID=3981 RepID=A0A6A6K8Z4_HEVBR|nr:hypothetical protein GH714_040374 [Hevea brasiliensis]
MDGGCERALGAIGEDKRDFNDGGDYNSGGKEAIVGKALDGGAKGACKRGGGEFDLRMLAVSYSSNEIDKVLDRMVALSHGPNPFIGVV